MTTPDPLAHWPLLNNAQDAQGKHHGQARDVTFESGAAHFSGAGSAIQVPDAPGLQLGSKDFTITAWIKCHQALTGPHGDILSKFDDLRRTGVTLSVAASAAGYSSFGDSRFVHAGIDDGYLSPFKDHGRPAADNPLISALTVFDGHLYAGTTDAARPADACKVFRWASGNKWVDCGRVSTDPNCPSVMSMIVHNGALYAGTGSWDWGRAWEFQHAKPPIAITRVYRYEGGTKWVDTHMPGQGQRVLCLASFKGHLYAGLDRGDQGRCYRLEGDKWVNAGILDDKDNFECLMPLDGELYGASHFAVYKYEAGTRWTCIGRRPFDITQIHSLAVYQGKLWAGTWPQGYALRYEGDGKWANTGLLGIATDKPGVAPINEINALSVHHGKLYAGLLPKAEVYRYERDGVWTLVDSLASTPHWDMAVCPSWMRVLSITTHKGRLFACTGASQARTQDIDPHLTAGRVLSWQTGVAASHEKDIGSTWTHLAMTKGASGVQLYINGKLSSRAATPPRRSFNLCNAAPLLIGSGPAASFTGAIRDVRLYESQLTPTQVRSVTKNTPA